ncbi:MAG: YggS family pyridoxal phosphate-dependent enzyme [Chitinophagaceae bacterium]|nr:YggS family pyridoxal phosphate-dependent enzyme [Chitinophagaceae bacterium]
MAVNKDKYLQLTRSLGNKTTLVAVSKFRTAEEIMELYQLGQRDFGENYVQELIEKRLLLPQDIRWHFIGHLQTNKVKFIAPFVRLVESVDSFKLLMEIDRQAKKANRVIDCLLQAHIADEDTKFGLHEEELDELIKGLTAAEKIHELNNIRVVGLMGMASFTGDEQKLRAEFKSLASLFDKYASMQTTNIHFKTLSMGMSADYAMAIEEGSNMVRIGSLLFGERPLKSGKKI